VYPVIARAVSRFPHPIPSSTLASTFSPPNGLFQPVVLFFPFLVRTRTYIQTHARRREFYGVSLALSHPAPSLRSNATSRSKALSFNIAETAADLWILIMACFRRLLGAYWQFVRQLTVKFLNLINRTWDGALSAHIHAYALKCVRRLVKYLGGNILSERNNVYVGFLIKRF